MASTDEYGPIQASDQAVGSDESAPSLATDGHATNNWDEVAWYISGGTTCDVTAWWYDDLGGVWCAGDTNSITTTSGVILQYTLGRRVFLQLTSVVGTWNKNFNLIRKDA